LVELMTLAENERSKVLSVSGINETQILQTQRSNICKLNSSRVAEGIIPVIKFYLAYNASS
jgi:hypothetical protein